MQKAVTGSATRPWMSVKEASQHTGLAESTLRSAIKEGRLRALRNGSRAFKILPDDLDGFAETLIYKPE